ncbi:MAG: hypothetical protein HKN67_13030 [Saprospiraceae bacterium]|nr:hypothetical protein [Bacteroidia bacterium]MBT8229482.1 hypothetical protein [Bacteroidia bacterium]NNF22860.1 hypothetical protein [Saprospiraceae bacterium]
MMKTINFLFGATLVLCLTIFSFTHSKAQDNSFIISIDYMHTTSANDYINLERTVYKPLHEYSVNNGEKLGWILYEIIYPYGEDTKYNYATVNFYKDAKQALDMSWTDFMVGFNEIHPDLDVAKVDQKTQNSRTLVKGEMFAMVDEAIPGFSNKPSEYISVNHMVISPGKDQEYIGMEMEIWKPVHQQRIKEGNAEDWYLFRRMFPYGAEFGYQYVTVDAHGTLEKMITPNSNTTWSSAHPDKAELEYQDKTSELRTLKRQETWRIIDFTFGSDNE